MTLPTVHEFSTSNIAPFSIAAGPDGNLWFTEVGIPSTATGTAIGKITPSGVITEFPWHGNPGGIVSDGTKLWFTEIGGNAIGSITTDGVFGAEIAIPSANALAHEIATDASGNLWFAENTTDVE